MIDLFLLKAFSVTVKENIPKAKEDFISYLFKYIESTNCIFFFFSKFWISVLNSLHFRLISAEDNPS